MPPRLEHERRACPFSSKDQSDPGRSELMTSSRFEAVWPKPPEPIAMHNTVNPLVFDGCASVGCLSGPSARARRALAGPRQDMPGARHRVAPGALVGRAGTTRPSPARASAPSKLSGSCGTPSTAPPRMRARIDSYTCRCRWPSKRPARVGAARKRVGRLLEASRLNSRGERKHQPWNARDRNRAKPRRAQQGGIEGALRRTRGHGGHASKGGLRFLQCRHRSELSLAKL